MNAGALRPRPLQDPTRDTSAAALLQRKAARLYMRWLPVWRQRDGTIEERDVIIRHIELGRRGRASWQSSGGSRVM